MSDEPQVSDVVEGEVLPVAEAHGPEETPDAASLGLELPGEPDAAIDLLLREVAAARAEASAYLEDLRRVAADFDNFRKRALREQQQTVERAAERVVAALLPVLDSLDAALAIEARSDTEQKLLAGVRGTHQLLLDILAGEGLEVVPTWDEPFDPEIHEAVSSTANGTGGLIVSKELRRGYRLRGRVVRAALVEVADRAEVT
ncbi:MAG: nucleotide exchange factor GrpE [Acidimicrobiia bacterium]|jgi:molecular chaperone GrpE